jgi:hypothetical protein
VWGGGGHLSISGKPNRETSDYFFLIQAKKNSNPHKCGLKVMRDLQTRLLEDYNSASDWVRREGNLVLN